MPHARGPVILTLQSATASLTPAYPPPPPCPAGCCAGLQIALKVNRARVVFVHLAQQFLHVLLPRGVERAASWAEAGGARGGEGLPGVLVAGWSWPPPGVAAKRLKEPAADGCLCSVLPAARATHGTGHGTSCRDHPGMPGSGRPARLRHALPHTPRYLFGLAAQRAHDDPEVLRIDRARPILVEQVERVLDLIELVLVQLLLSSVELSLCSLLGLRTRADRQQPGCGRAWLTRTWLFLLLSGLLAMAAGWDAPVRTRETRNSAAASRRPRVIFGLT